MRKLFEDSMDALDEFADITASTKEKVFGKM